MFTSNPFAELSASISPAMMQTYVVIMVILVAAGTLFDVLHKGSARYFFENFRKSRAKAKKQVGGGESTHRHRRGGVSKTIDPPEQLADGAQVRIAGDEASADANND